LPSKIDKKTDFKIVNQLPRSRANEVWNTSV